MTTQPVLQDRRGLVTGGAKGIGAAISERLAAAGADLVVSGRNAAELDAYAAQLSERTGRKVATVAADLAEPDAPERLAEQAWAAFGGLAPARPGLCPWVIRLIRVASVALDDGSKPSAAALVVMA